MQDKSNSNSFSHMQPSGASKTTNDSSILKKNDPPEVKLTRVGIQKPTVEKDAQGNVTINYGARTSSPTKSGLEQFKEKPEEERKKFEARLQTQKIRNGITVQRADVSKKPGVNKSTSGLEGDYKIGAKAEELRGSGNGKTSGWQSVLQAAKQPSKLAKFEMDAGGASGMKSAFGGSSKPEPPPPPPKELSKAGSHADQSMNNGHLQVTSQALAEFKQRHGFTDALNKAGMAAPSLPMPSAPKISKMDQKKQQLIQMARLGKERPLTSTPIGHAFANYTDPNSYSFDPKFAALISRIAPNWAKK
ncbi:hypothetical protein UFOVP244_11 [uncultured Caudovirales phage]|uniref:Uncharacterized protein n=1 Tax=uncultured Caudovirales phage TaxID=2100421 RepID=A0A6J7WRH3_9CAUD|nr:hypothetical protein UFOVP244_11 [uncultured Caudovirales phage]